MKASFAKGIANNISEIVKATTERLMPFDETSDRQVARLLDCEKRIKKAEDRIAQWLMQPGAQRPNADIAAGPLVTRALDFVQQIAKLPLSSEDAIEERNDLVVRARKLLGIPVTDDIS